MFLWHKAGKVHYLDVTKVGRYSISFDGYPRKWRVYLNNKSLLEGRSVDELKAAVEERVTMARKINAMHGD